MVSIRGKVPRVNRAPPHTVEDLHGNNRDVLGNPEGAAPHGTTTERVKDLKLREDIA